MVEWWGCSFAFPSEPSVGNAKEQSESAETSSESSVSSSKNSTSLSDISSNQSTETCSSEDNLSDSEDKFPCRFKTRQLGCKFTCVEDEYYCTKHLQFGGDEILSGYRSPKPVSLSANLFMTYGDFILTKVFYYGNTVTNSEFDCLRKLILENVAGRPAVFIGAIWYLLLVFLEYDWTFSIVEHGRNFTPAVIFGFLYDEELAEDVLLKLSSFTRSQLLRDCSTQMNLTTRGSWTEE